MNKSKVFNLTLAIAAIFLVNFLIGKNFFMATAAPAPQ
jgi:hypothetical protein